MATRNLILSTWLGVLMALLPATQAAAQIYAFHSEIQGIYWNPELAGWGFAFDVQKGILFGAVYGYDDAGEPVFYTLISEKNDGNAGLTFTGDVFLTRANGTSTEPVGEFDLQFGRNGGQPALSISMNSPSLDLSDFLLVRFSYAESDELGLVSGARIRTWFGTPTEPADQNGATWTFTNDRTVVDGQVTLDVVDDEGTSGFAALVRTETITTYVVFFPIADAQTLTYDYDLLNDRGGQGLRLVLDDQGNIVGDYANFSSAIVGIEESSSKTEFEPVAAGRRGEIIASFAQYLEAMGR